MADRSVTALDGRHPPAERPGKAWRVLDKAPRKRGLRSVREVLPARAETATPFGSDVGRGKGDGVHGRIVTTEQDFHALQAGWRELSSQMARSSAFRSWDFAVEWFKCYVAARVAGATGRFQIVVAVNDAGQMIGLLPLYEERLPLGNGNLGTTMQPFGRGTSFDPMTDEPIVLLRKGYEQAAKRYLRSMAPAPSGWSAWDVAVMDEFDPDESGAAAPTLLAGGGKSLEVKRHRPGLMQVKLPRTWQQFKSALSKSMRDNVHYYPRKLTREFGPWTIRTARAPEDIAQATEALIALHRHRSQSHVGTPHLSHIPSEANATFLRNWFRRLAWRNSMSIVTIEIGGRAIAAQAFIETPRAMFVYYSGYHETWYRCSPLTIIMSAAIQDAIARNFDTLDFPPNPTAYKSRWGAVEANPTVQTFLYSLRLPALLRGAARRVSRTRVVQDLASLW